MNAISQLHTNTFDNVTIEPIVSPCGADLPLLLFPSSEGLSEELGVDVYYGETSLINLDNHFDIEKGSDQISEHLKLQRDVDDARVNGLTTYLKTRPDYTFPTLIIVVNKLSDIEVHNFKSGRVVEAVLNAEYHRFICDGQGRTFTIKSLLPELPALQRHGIGFKLIVTNTESIYDAEKVIKQVFADVNGKTKKPSTSQSLYFDSAKPYSCMLRELIHMDITVGESTIPLVTMLAMQGVIGKGKLWQYKQFSSFFCTLFGKTEAQLNKDLADKETYQQSIEVGRKLVQHVISRLPLEMLFADDWRAAHARSLFTKALFAKGVALTVQALMDEAVQSGAVQWDKLDGLTALPIADINEKIWLQRGVMEKLDNDKLRIVKGCDKRIARVLCHELRIMPNQSILEI